MGYLVPHEPPFPPDQRAGRTDERTLSFLGGVASLFVTFDERGDVARTAVYLAHGGYIELLPEDQQQEIADALAQMGGSLPSTIED